jgi:lipid-A-disaccharide synthase
MPALIDAQATPQALSAALAPLVTDTPERRAQLKLFSDVERTMTLPDGLDPAVATARAVLEALATPRRALPRL